jgi:hypothetical protein
MMLGFCGRWDGDMDLPSWLEMLMKDVSHSIRDAAPASFGEDIHATWDDSVLVELGREQITRDGVGALPTVERGSTDEHWERG